MPRLWELRSCQYHCSKNIYTIFPTCIIMLHIEQSSLSQYSIETGRNYLLVIISPYLKTEHRALFCATASCWLLYYVEI